MKRLKPEARKEHILATALLLAEAQGYARLTREQITTAAGVTGPVLSHHFGTMPQFRRSLMQYAIEKESLAVVAQGLAAGDPQAQGASEALRRRALDGLL